MTRLASRSALARRRRDLEVVILHEIRIHPVRLPLRRVLRIGSRVIRERSTLLVEARASDGTTGWGEAAPPPGESTSPSHSLPDASWLPAATGDVLRRLDCFDPRHRKPTLRAMETALLDLDARSRGRRLCEHLAPVQRTRVPVNALLTELDPSAAAAEARALANRGFRHLKLKVDPYRIDAEERRLAAIRSAIRPHVRLRLDLNATATVEQAVFVLSRLARYSIEYVEQPVPGIDDLARVRRAVDVPIAADESIRDVTSAHMVIEANAADWIVIKPGWLGPSASMEIARHAQAAGVGVVITSVLDSAIGTAAALHVAAAIPEPTAAAGLASVELFDDALADLVIEDGHILLPDGPGLGVRPCPASLRRWQSTDGTGGHE